MRRDYTPHELSQVCHTTGGGSNFPRLLPRYAGQHTDQFQNLSTWVTYAEVSAYDCSNASFSSIIPNEAVIWRR